MKYWFQMWTAIKNSLAIIYVYLKMHCLKYVANFILFYLFLFMWPRCGYLMFLSAPPPCLKLTILISFSLARLLPFPHTRFGRYQEERHMCAWSDWPWAGGHPYQVFLKSSPCFTVSSVVPVECWKFVPSTPVLAAPLHFFSCITQSK